MRDKHLVNCANSIERLYFLLVSVLLFQLYMRLSEAEVMGFPIDVFTVRLFIRLLVGLILLSVGVSKLLHPRRFQMGIQDYKVLPSNVESKLHFSSVLSYCIPLVELVAGLGLMSGFLLVPAALLTMMLFVLFSGVILLNLLRGRRDLSCHCGGALGDHRISWWLIGRNGLLMVAIFFLLFTPPDIFTLNRLLRSPSALSATMWVSRVLSVTLLVIGVWVLLLLFNAARIVLRTE